jgi:hypothetical protein
MGYAKDKCARVDRSFHYTTERARHMIVRAPLVPADWQQCGFAIR